MTIPSSNVRDYPNLTRAVNQFVAEINERSPYHYGNHQRSNLWNVHYYYVENGAFIIDYDWFGNAAAMSIEFGSRGRKDGDGGNKPGMSREDPPLSRIVEWVKKKRIRGYNRRSEVTGRFIRGRYNVRQVAWQIKRKIGEHGTRAKKYGQQIVEEVFPKYEEAFNEALAQDIDYQIQKYYPDLIQP